MAKKLNILLVDFSKKDLTDKAPALKTNYKDPAKRYELSERIIWSQTPKWKQHVIARCKLSKTEDRILNEYAQAVIILAESEDTLFKADKLPPVPSFDLAKEIEADKGLTKP